MSSILQFPKDKQIPAIYLFLTVITIIGFRQVSQCNFINFDDPLYVTENIHIQNGITMEAIRWAFTTGHAAYWHPLTWLSHMLDVQLFGLNPRWHHLTNLLFHIANTLLVFFVFNRMTKAPYKSAFVAVLFAIHPLHVESVAWVAERKDVLSTFFWMLTMAAYIHYVEHPRLGSYLAVLTCFALGLMAKPMLVTLPFVLLLLDYWPLRRFEESGKVTGRGVAQSSALGPLLVEKIPLFALAALACIVIFIAQLKGGAVAPLQTTPLSVRVANACISYVIYIEKTILPADLAIFYPHPGFLPIWQVAGAAVLLGAVTFAVILLGKKHPCLPLGWLWYAGTLVPVIGIVQVGSQAMADRFTYIPLIGLFIMAAWGIPELLGKWPYRKEALFASSVLILPCFLIATCSQVRYWRNNITLYDHALEVTSRNDFIHSNRGDAYYNLGNYRQAIEDYDRAIEINPKLAEAYNNRGAAYDKLGNRAQAISDFGRAVDINPNYADAYNARGLAYAALGRDREAISDFDKAIGINPQYADAYNNRGVAYARLGNSNQAIFDYDNAIEINPQNAEVYSNRGIAYGNRGNHRRAIEDFDRAIEISPGHTDAYFNRCVAEDKLGNHSQAIQDCDKAIEIDPGNPEAYFNRGVAYGELGNHRKAIENFDRVIGLNPGDRRAYFNRAVSFGELGDGGQAIEDLKTAAKLGSEDAKEYLRSRRINW